MNYNTSSKSNRRPKSLKYLTKYPSPNEAFRRDFDNIEVELENENLKRMIVILEGKNKVLEEHCNFLKEKNHYYETRLRGKDDLGDKTSQKESEEDEVSDDENKTKSIKDKIGGFLFGVALPNMGQIAHKIKEKHQEMGENGAKCPKINIKEKIQVLKVNLFRVVIVFGTLMVVSGVGYAGYRIWKNRYRNPSYLAQSDDDEDSELFITPGASGGTDNMAKSNSTDSFERPGISTDFESILDTRNNK